MVLWVSHEHIIHGYWSDAIRFKIDLVSIRLTEEGVNDLPKRGINTNGWI